MALAEGLFDIVHEIAATAQTEFAGDEFAVAVQEESCGEDANSTVALSYGFFSDEDGVVDAHFFREFGDVFGAGVVHGNAHDLETLGAVFFLELDKPRHLDLAGAAIGCPEIEQDGLAAQI